MNNKSADRITSPMSAWDIVVTLSECNPGAIRVITEWLETNPNSTLGLLELLQLDTKRLYGHRIWELYSDVCGKDIERFKYHVCVELPNQETGKLSVTGPYTPAHDDQTFWTKRQFGKPGSFWALENPPTEVDYVYPIR